MPHPGRCAAPLLAALLAAPPAWGDALDSALRTESQLQVAAQQSQDRIDALAEEADELTRRYRSLIEEIDSLRIYNDKLEELVGAQRREMESLGEQLDRVTHIEREMTPLILRMIDALERFVELDVPFLLEERRERIARLRGLMDRADVSIAEKYRLLLEAYQVENEYGRTIEAYRGTLESDGGRRTVDFLRIGRVALVYQSLDGEERGYWDPEAGAWRPLPGRYRGAIREGLRIARKQLAPDLITMPVPAPEPTE